MAGQDFYLLQKGMTLTTGAVFFPVFFCSFLDQTKADNGFQADKERTVDIAKPRDAHPLMESKVAPG